jgi:inactivated superfamily I helicase
MTYKMNEKSGTEIFDTLIAMNEHPMKANPFQQSIARSIKVLHFDNQGLNVDAINLMCQKNYIQTYSKSNDQLEYFTDIYSDALAKIKKNK